MVTAWRLARILDFGSVWIDGDQRSWWIVFGLVSCVGRGLGGGIGVVGQVMGLDRWIGVSWVRWWCGFGLVAFSVGGMVSMFLFIYLFLFVVAGARSRGMLGVL